jgi:hypothetical protein
MWRSLEPFKQDIEVHELSKDNIEAVGKFGGGGGSSEVQTKGTIGGLKYSRYGRARILSTR